MKKFLIIILLITVSLPIIYSSEEKNNKNNYKDVFEIEFSEGYTITERELNNKFTPCSISTRSSRNLIEMGKILTFTGIGGFGGAVLFTALGFVFGLSALYSAGALSSTHGLLWSTFLAVLNTSPAVMTLTCFTIAFWVIGTLAFMMAILIIPGIVIWAIGAAKGKSRVTMTQDNIGFSIKL